MNLVADTEEPSVLVGQDVFVVHIPKPDVFLPVPGKVAKLEPGSAWVLMTLPNGEGGTHTVLALYFTPFIFHSFDEARDCALRGIRDRIAIFEENMNIQRASLLGMTG